MRIVELLVAAVLLYAFVAGVVLFLRKSKEPTLEKTDHNHLALARWIEHQLARDIEGIPFLTPTDRARAIDLLTEFHGDDYRKELPP